MEKLSLVFGVIGVNELFCCLFQLGQEKMSISTMNDKPRGELEWCCFDGEIWEYLESVLHFTI